MNSRYDWRKWQRESPYLFYGALFILAWLAVYILILMPFNYAIYAKQASIDKQEKDLVWMSRAAREINRLNQEAPSSRQKTTESTFSIVNTSINEEGLKELVTDVRQMEQSQVQVNFSSITFTDLMKWLNKLSSRNGIFVSQATLQKAGPGKVQATLILQGT